MMDSIFALPRDIPKHLEEAPLFRVSKYISYSHNRKDATEGFRDNVNHYKEKFGIKGDVKDNGTEVVFMDGSKVLEIYRPSDSIWWRDLDLAYRECVPEGTELPNDKEAREIALRKLEDLNIESKYAKIASVTYTKMALSKADKKDRSETRKTEVHVNFSFTVEGYPIMGPGAKMRISLIEDGKMSSFLKFWRDPNKDGEIKVITPEEALGSLIEDTRYAQMPSSKNHISLNKMQFGYYAMPPFEFQRFLIPVYEIKGIEETELLGKKDFTTYLPAMQLDPKTMKKTGFADRSQFEEVLPSTN